MMLAVPDYARAKAAAASLLNQFAISNPPVDPVTMARQLGMNVLFATFAESWRNVSGFYDPKENSIYVNGEEYPLRQTFTVAHELGHKVLHEEWAKSSSYRILYRDPSLNDDSDPYEKEANAFAANLLVPRFMLDQYWQRASVEQLSQLFAVSVPVIKFRLAFEYGI